MNRDVSRKIGTVIDYTALSLLGVMCVAYSHLTRKFAQLHITLDSLDLPVFVGELLLAFLLIAYFIKHGTSGSKISFRNYRGTAVYIILFGVFILCKSFWGYLRYGPLAFRHAALFYYSLFALFSYEFYNKRFFNRKMILFLSFLLTAIVVIRAFDTYAYFMFTYFLLALFLISMLPVKSLKILLAFLLIGLAPYQRCIAASRASVMGAVSGIFVSGILFFSGKYRSNRVLKLWIVIGVLAVTGILLSAYVNKNKMESFLQLSILPEAIKNIDDFVEQNQGRVPKKQLAVRLYSEDGAIIEDSPQQGIKSDLVTAFADLGSKLSDSEVSGGKKMHSSEDKKYKSTAADKDKNSQATEGETVEAAPLAVDNTGLNNILWRILVIRDMFRDLYKSNWFVGSDFGKPFRSRTIEVLRWNKIEIEEVGWIEPHNSYVHIIYRSGLIGLISIILLIKLIMQTAAKFLKDRRQGLILVAALTYWIVAANFMVILELPFFAIPFWSLFGITLAYAQKKEQ